MDLPEIEQAPEAIHYLLKMKVIDSTNSGGFLWQQMDEMEYLDLLIILRCLKYLAKAKEMARGMNGGSGQTASTIPGASGSTVSVMNFADPTVADSGGEADEEDD
jgi:hypothetical protein